MKKQLIYECSMLWNVKTGYGRRWKHYDDGSIEIEDFPMVAPIMPTIFWF